MEETVNFHSFILGLNFGHFCSVCVFFYVCACIQKAWRKHTSYLAESHEKGLDKLTKTTLIFINLIMLSFATRWWKAWNVKTWLYGLWVLESLVSDQYLWHHHQQSSLFPCNSHLFLTALLSVKRFHSLERKPLSEHNCRELIFCQAVNLLYNNLMPFTWKNCTMDFNR